jgi:hypothetical protein
MSQADKEWGKATSTSLHSGCNRWGQASCNVTMRTGIPWSPDRWNNLTTTYRAAITDQKERKETESGPSNNSELFSCPYARIRCLQVLKGLGLNAVCDARRQGVGCIGFCRGGRCSSAYRTGGGRKGKPCGHENTSGPTLLDDMILSNPLFRRQLLFYTHDLIFWLTPGRAWQERYMCSAYRRAGSEGVRTLRNRN